VKLRLGTHTLDLIDVRPHPGIAGLDEVRFHLPQDYPLHLYQIVAVETPDGTSNSLWIYLK